MNDERRPTGKEKGKQQKEVNRIIAVLHLKPPKEDRESYRRYIVGDIVMTNSDTKYADLLSGHWL